MPEMYLLYLLVRYVIDPWQRVTNWLEKTVEKMFGVQISSDYSREVQSAPEECEDWDEYVDVLSSPPPATK